MLQIRHHMPPLAFLLCSLAAGLIWASGSQAATTQAHTHGAAEITFSIDENQVDIQLQSPAANIVGFESKAANPQQRLLVTQAKAKLEAEQRLFSFTGAKCQRESVTVDVSSVMAETKGEHDAHAPGETDAESHHETHNDHADEAHETHHSEIVANYRFRCDDTADLAGVAVEIFNDFPGIERMQAMWVTPVKQGATELNARQRIVSFE